MIVALRSLMLLSADVLLQGRRRGVQETQEALILEPDFSDSNLASIQQGPLLG